MPKTCDDGNVADGDGCGSTCSIEICGDGVVDFGEACDDGNIEGGDGCDSTCEIEACGNGINQVGEACDDGNLNPGDGCDSSCRVEGCDPNLDSDNDGLSDCVETNTGIFLSRDSTGTDPLDGDSDDDGLSDYVEIYGTSGGLNLPGMGANPNRKDIFWEIDWLVDVDNRCGEEHGFPARRRDC